MIGEATGPKASNVEKMSVMIFLMEDFSLNLEDFIPFIISGKKILPSWWVVT